MKGVQYIVFKDHFFYCTRQRTFFMFMAILWIIYWCPLYHIMSRHLSLSNWFERALYRVSPLALYLLSMPRYFFPVCHLHSWFVLVDFWKIHFQCLHSHKNLWILHLKYVFHCFYNQKGHFCGTLYLFICYHLIIINIEFNLFSHFIWNSQSLNFLPFLANL